MSANVYTSSELIVTCLAAPADEGPDRARWQFTPPCGFATLNRVEATELCIALAESLGGKGYIVSDGLPWTEAPE